MIPKIIHYCWFGGNPIPEQNKKCIESWKKYCPDYKIIEWNESNFDLNCCNYVKEAYEAKKWAFITDFARLKILYENGGIYFDTDVELIKPIDAFLKYDGYFGFENEKHIATGLGFGSVKGNKILKLLINDYLNIHFTTDNGYDLTPCPVRNTKIFTSIGLQCNNQLQFINNNAFFPTEYFSPISYETGKKRITQNTVSIHWFNSSWQSNESKEYHRLHIKLSKLLGPKNADILLGIYFSVKKEGLTHYIKNRIKLIK